MKQTRPLLKGLRVRPNTLLRDETHQITAPNNFIKGNNVVQQLKTHVGWGLNKSERSSLYLLPKLVVCTHTWATKQKGKHLLWKGRLCKGCEVISQNCPSHSAVVPIKTMFSGRMNNSPSGESTSLCLALGAVCSGRNYSPIHQHWACSLSKIFVPMHRKVQYKYS